MTTTTPEYFNGFGAEHLPGFVGVEILTVTPEAVESRLPVRKSVMAPNGFLHAASVIALADTSCGYGCVALLPQGASGFTTVELKANFLGTARSGAIRCPGASGAHHPGLGCARERGGERCQDRPLPVYATHLVAQVALALPERACL